MQAAKIPKNCPHCTIRVEELGVLSRPTRGALNTEGSAVMLCKTRTARNSVLFASILKKIIGMVDIGHFEVDAASCSIAMVCLMVISV